MKDKYEAAKDAWRKAFTRSPIEDAFCAAFVDAIEKAERGEKKPRMVVDECPGRACDTGHVGIHAERATCSTTCACHDLPCRPATDDEIRVGHRIAKPKPRRMKANPDTFVNEHDEGPACKLSPACVPVDAPEWKAGDTVEIVDTSCSHCGPIKVSAGTRLRLLTKDGDCWECYPVIPDGISWSVCRSCARLVPQPQPQRDWEKMPEVGDVVRNVNWGHTLHRVVAHEMGRFWLQGGPELRGSATLEQLVLLTKRPDSCGDGFERIGHEGEGIYLMWDDHAFHAPGRFYSDRSEFRRVYTKRD